MCSDGRASGTARRYRHCSESYSESSGSGTNRKVSVSWTGISGHCVASVAPMACWGHAQLRDSAAVGKVEPVVSTLWTGTNNIDLGHVVLSKKRNRNLRRPDFAYKRCGPGCDTEYITPHHTWSLCPGSQLGPGCALSARHNHFEGPCTPHPRLRLTHIALHT